MKFRRAQLRKLICTLIISTILAALSNCTFAFDDGITVILNGERMVFTDAQPYIKDSRTLVPFRKIFEAFGMQVSWDGDKRQVLGKGNGTEILLTIDDTTAYVNNAKKTLDVPAQITNSRTYVPLRFVSESVGADVQWNGGTKTVTINYKGLEVSQPDEIGDYKVGQIGEADGFRFAIDSVSLDPANNTVVVNGRISDSSKDLLVYVFDKSNRYMFMKATYIANSSNMNPFKAGTVNTYDGDFTIDRVVFGYRDNNKVFKSIAEYKMK